MITIMIVNNGSTATATAGPTGIYGVLYSVLRNRIPPRAFDEPTGGNSTSLARAARRSPPGERPGEVEIFIGNEPRSHESAVLFSDETP